MTVICFNRKERVLYFYFRSLAGIVQSNTGGGLALNGKLTWMRNNK